MAVFREISKKVQWTVKKLQVSVSVNRYSNFAPIFLLEIEISDKIKKLDKYMY